ncbi:hypothetical protein N7540_002288 [Penicillium herquei]|nr:hypothetical protein N7540_002288 [Penicillium herquei]
MSRDDGGTRYTVRDSPISHSGDTGEGFEKQVHAIANIFDRAANLNKEVCHALKLTLLDQVPRPTAHGVGELGAAKWFSEYDDDNGAEYLKVPGLSATLEVVHIVMFYALLQVESDISIAKPPAAVFEFISSPINWVVGTRFIEVIDDKNGLKFDAEWVVTRNYKDEFFQFQFPSDYSHGPFQEIIITYNVSQNTDGSTSFTRRMVSWIKPGVDTKPLSSFYENDMHNDYVAAVKARVEAI